MMAYLLLLLCFSLTGYNSNDEPENRLETRVMRFDAGTSNTEPGFFTLNTEDTYNSERGYGWTTPLAQRFIRSTPALFRPPSLVDGVQDQNIGFRADLPEGKWWITLWMEAGLEDINTAQLILNGQPEDLAWNAFIPPAEPRNAIQNIYRVLHKPVEVNNDGLHFELIGEADSVRILAFHLYPAPPTTSENNSFLDQMKSLGSYSNMLYHPGIDEGSVLETMQARTSELITIQKTLEKNNDSLFSQYWHDQLDLLILAENLFAMRGWGWADIETGRSLFERIHQAIMILDGILDRPFASEFPFYERALFTRARLLHWLQVEGSEPEEIAGIRQPDFKTLYQSYPGDTLLAMYNGEKFDLPDACDALAMPAQAPEWARAQYETLCRLKGIAHWWVQDQQAPNGELGGKFGDDVEILRWWPALILSGDSVTLNGWQRLADGVWNSGKIRDGYAKNVSDVEHASEFVSDTAPVLTLFSDDPMYTDRLRPSARLFEELWTGTTQNGHRLFKSSWYSSSELDMLPPRNRDVTYNTRATKAIRYLAWKTEDAHINGLLAQWATTWAEAAMRTDKGKPAGLFPASLRYPDGAFNGDDPTWYDANMFWSYFNWSNHTGSMMLDQLLFSYAQTGDEKLIQPLLLTLDLIQTHGDSLQDPHPLEPGSARWAVNRLLENTRFWSVVSQWRVLTGDNRYDDILARYGTPYVQFRLTGDEKYLVTGLQEILDKVRFNTPLLTYEAIHTDRIYVTDSNAGSSVLKAMLTGDGMIEDMSPYPVITWEKTPAGFTALVTHSSSDTIEVQLFIFNDDASEITARLWEPDQGNVSVSLTDGSERVIFKTPLSIDSRGQRFRFNAEGNQHLTLTLIRHP